MPSVRAAQGRRSLECRQVRRLLCTSNTAAPVVNVTFDHRNVAGRWRDGSPDFLNNNFGCWDPTLVDGVPGGIAGDLAAEPVQATGRSLKGICLFGSRSD